MQATEVYNKLLSNAPDLDDLIEIENLYASRKEKPKLAAFLLDHKEEIYSLLKASVTHETQMLMLKIISKTLTKKQLTHSQFFKFFTKKCTETEIYNFLVEFNFMYNHKIICSEFESFICKEKNVNLQKGAIFLTSKTLKLYSGQNIVIINFSSILSLSVQESKVLITANENKTAEITFIKNEHSSVFLSQMKKLLAPKIIYDESLEFEKIIQNSQQNVKKAIKTAQESTFIDNLMTAENDSDHSETSVKQSDNKLKNDVIKNDSESNETVVKQLERELRVKFNEELNTYKTISIDEQVECEESSKTEDTIPNSDQEESKTNQFDRKPIKDEKHNNKKKKTKSIHNDNQPKNESKTKIKNVSKKSKRQKTLKSKKKLLKKKAAKRCFNKKIKNFIGRKKNYKNVFSSKIKCKIDDWYFLHLKLIKEKNKEMKRKAKKHKDILLSMVNTKYLSPKSYLNKL